MLVQLDTNTHTHTQTHKQTVNDISAPCQSACVDNKCCNKCFLQHLYYVIIRLKRANYRNTLGAKTVFTRSAITPPKVNRFRWNLEHCEHIVGGSPWQILGAIQTATVWEAGEILFFFRQLNNARFSRFLVRWISRNFNTTTSIGVM